MEIEEVRKYFGILQPFDSEDVLNKIKEENEEAIEIYELNEEEEQQQY